MYKRQEEISCGNVWNAVTMSRIQSVIMESLKYACHAYSAAVSTHLFLLLAQSEDNRPQRLKGFLEIALSMCCLLYTSAGSGARWCARNYMLFHTMDPEIAIEDLIEIKKQKQ